MFQCTARRALCALVLVACLGGSTFIASPASAEKAWVHKENRLNLRTGPSGQNRIIGVVQTGDAVQVITRGDGWTKVRKIEDGKEGWILAGYLNAMAPPAVRLVEVEARAEELTAELARVSRRANELGETNEVLSSQDGEQEAQIKSLTLENMELKAGARYPEWITGALIFASGMLLGAILRSSFAKRAPQRVRF